MVAYNQAIDIFRDLGIGLGGGSNIKSIQRGTTLMGTVTSQNVAISSVDINSSIVLIEYPVDNAGITGETQVTGKITSATNLQLLRNVADVNSPNVEVIWQAIEFKNVKSLQKGSVFFNSQGIKTKNVIINSVDMEKAFVLSSIRHAYKFGAGSSQIKLNSATQIQINALVPNNVNTNIEWQVIEFK